jgi:TRAP-type C4-dicarboxylate transport system permease small subunit
MSPSGSEGTAPAVAQPDIGIWLDRVLGAAAAAILLGLMLLTVADVVSRYIFNWPLRGAFEVTELALLVLIFAGLPLASRTGEHATMDFIDALLAERGRRAVVRFVDLFCGFVILGLAWQVWLKAGKIAGYGDTTDALKLPVGPFVYFMAVMVAITGLVHMFKAILPGRLETKSAFDPDKTTPI